MKISAWLKWYIYSIKYRKPHVYLTDDAIYIFDKKSLFHSRCITKISKEGLFYSDHGITGKWTSTLKNFEGDANV